MNMEYERAPYHYMSVIKRADSKIRALLYQLTLTTLKTFMYIFTGNTLLSYCNKDW